MTSARILSEDEKLARRLQMEEDTKHTSRGLSTQQTAEQEHRDAELARQLADMDRKPSAVANRHKHARSYDSQDFANLGDSTPSAAPDHNNMSFSASYSTNPHGSPRRRFEHTMNGSGGEDYGDYNKSPAAYSSNRSPAHTRRHSEALSPKHYAQDGSHYRRNTMVDNHGNMKVPLSSLPPERGTPRRVLMNDDYRSGAYSDDRRQVQGSGRSSRSSSTGSANEKSTSIDERFELARKLQEQAFFSVVASREKESTEQADRELALRIAKEEGNQVWTSKSSASTLEKVEPTLVPTKSGPSKERLKRRGVSLDDALDRDKALAEFIEDSGASLSDLSADFINDIIASQGPEVEGGNAGNAGDAGDDSGRISADNTRTEHVPLSPRRSGRRPAPVQATNIPPASNSGVPRSHNPTPPSCTMSSMSSSGASSRLSMQPDRNMGHASIPNPPVMRSPAPHTGINQSPPQANVFMEHGAIPRVPPMSPGNVHVAPSEGSAQTIAVSSPRLAPESGPESPANENKSKKIKGKRRSLLSFGRSNNRDELEESANIPGNIPPPPACIPDPPKGPSNITGPSPSRMPCPPVVVPRPAGIPCAIPVVPLGHGPSHHPGGSSVSSRVPLPVSNVPHHPPPVPGGRSMCAICYRTTGSFLAALGKKYHPECFRCLGCREQIDPYGQFRVKDDGRGGQQPYHIQCYANARGGIVCSVCRQRIPASKNGKVEYVKHPFFDSELMCRKHAQNPGRVCSGCRRFEPIDQKFVELSDSNRCICWGCSKSAIVDNRGVTPLWHQVLSFLEYELKLPLWSGMKDVPILLVGLETLSSQMSCSCGHYGAKQIMCSGLCLTDHQSNHGFRVKLTSMTYQSSTSSFETLDGVREYEIPHQQNHSSGVSLSAILCLCGLPRDLTAAVLAHEATHAWLKLNPKSRSHHFSNEVEEGCAQLVTMLFLKQLTPPRSDYEAELRDYYKFCIERDSTDTFGRGYKRASKAYRDIGIEALLNHVVDYGEFPHT